MRTLLEMYDIQLPSTTTLTRAEQRVVLIVYHTSLRTAGGRKPAQGSTTKAIMGLLVELSVWLGLTALLVTVDMSPLARHLVYGRLEGDL